MNGIHCAFEGRLGGDPEQRYTREGTATLTFSVAVDEGSAGAERSTSWARVTVWAELAEKLALAEVLQKGTRVYVEGRLRLNTWEGQDGQQRAALNVSAWMVLVLGAIGRRRGRGQPAAIGAPAEDAGGG